MVVLAKCPATGVYHKINQAIATLHWWEVADWTENLSIPSKRKSKIYPEKRA